MARSEKTAAPVPSLRGRIVFFAVLNAVALTALANFARKAGAHDRWEWAIFTIGPIALCASIAVWAMRQANFYRGALLATGTIVDPGTLQVTDRGAYYKDARLSYSTQAGNEVTVTLNLAAEHQPGDTLSIAYQPSRPAEIIQSRAQPAVQVASLQFSAAGFTVTGALLAICGAVLPHLAGAR